MRKLILRKKLLAGLIVFAAAEIFGKVVIHDIRRFCMFFLLLSVPALGLVCILYYRFLQGQILRPLARLKQVTAETYEADSEEGPAVVQIGHSGDEIDRVTAEIEQMAAEYHVCREQLIQLKGERAREAKKQSALAEWQKVLLDSAFPTALTLPGAKVRAARLPGTNGGDSFADFFAVDETHLGIAAAQLPETEPPCSSRLLAVKIQMKDGILAVRNPAAVLDELKHRVYLWGKAGDEINAWTGILDLTSGILTYAETGRNPLYIMKGGGESAVWSAGRRRWSTNPQEDQEIQKCHKAQTDHGTSEGPQRSAEVHISQQRLAMQTSDILFLCNANLLTAVDLYQEDYGEERLLSELNVLKNRTPEEILYGIRKDLEFFSMGAEQVCDIVTLSLKI